jgi:hypothetical protein
MDIKYIDGQNRGQITLLPDCIEDFIGQDNPVRVIDAFLKWMKKIRPKVILSIPLTKLKRQLKN